jgi:hypothetical protein
MKMNVQEKIAAIEQHAAKALIELRELRIYLTGHPAAVVSFTDVPEYTPARAVSIVRPGDVQRSRARGTGYVSPADESVEWPEDAA